MILRPSRAFSFLFRSLFFSLSEIVKNYRPKCFAIRYKASATASCSLLALRIALVLVRRRRLRLRLH